MTSEFSPEKRVPRYHSPRDELLHRMALAGWAAVTSGSTDSPMGRFSRITNTSDEHSELLAAFVDDFVELGTQLNDVTGNFLVRADDQGFVDVFEYGTPSELKHVFDRLNQFFNEWKDGDV